MTRIAEFKSNFINGVRPNLFKMEIAGISEKLKFMAKSTQLPGKSIGQIEVPYLNMKHKVAGDIIFDNLNVTILMDTDLIIRNSLESWMEDIKNNDAMFGKTPAEYERTGSVILLDQQGDDLTEYEFIGLWLVNLGPVELSFDSTDTIAEYTAEFAYTHWNKV